MTCNCIDKTLKCCHQCLNNNERSIMYRKIMEKTIYNRVKYGCKCYMCNDITSCSCIELSLFYENNGSYNDELIKMEIKKIKKQVKKDNHTIFRKYILCLLKFNQLFENIIEKRYRPGGEGYYETKKVLKIN